MIKYVFFHHTSFWLESCQYLIICHNIKTLKIHKKFLILYLLKIHKKFLILYYLKIHKKFIILYFCTQSRLIPYKVFLVPFYFLPRFVLMCFLKIGISLWSSWCFFADIRREYILHMGCGIFSCWPQDIDLIEKYWPPWLFLSITFTLIKNYVINLHIVILLRESVSIQSKKILESWTKIMA